MAKLAKNPYSLGIPIDGSPLTERDVKYPYEKVAPMLMAQ